jgi:mycofactocin system glycosyltransferase
MRGFTFRLETNTCLKENSNNYFLVSEAPLRILRLNRALFHVLKHLEEEDGLSEPCPQFCINDEDLAGNLLSLTSKGYLKLEKIAEPENYPTVSVIVPVKDRPEDILECVQSLVNLNYPEDKLEIIVVDDGSRKSIGDIIAQFNINLVRIDSSQGASTCRNIGAECAGGDILAFLDADCMADENWLKDLVPFLEIKGIGAAGGFVDSHYNKSVLDRYERSFSSLNMGKRTIFEGNTESNFYIPTCNLLVKRDVYISTGGFKAGMHVGEDVDFCWRMRKGGDILIYVPVGKVAHKHRNKLFQMLKRRKEYGTSEAPLYYTHRDKKKRFPVSVYAILSLLALVIAVVLKNPFILSGIVIFLGLDLYRKFTRLRRLNIHISFKQMLYSVLRSYFSFYYFASFHLVRYYLILLIGLGFLFHPLWIFSGVMLLFVSIVDYSIKRPALPYPAFLYFYTLEHLAYQVGVFWGCLKNGYFGAYIPSFSNS